jgi:hypothetical protein
LYHGRAWRPVHVVRQVHMPAPCLTEKDIILLIVLTSMKFFAAVILVCLLLAGNVSAKAASTDVGSSISNPAASAAASPILVGGVSYCSDNNASFGTSLSLGELDADSIPPGAAISIDGTAWIYKKLINGIPYVVSVVTPHTGRLEIGTHSVIISYSGYKNYVGTVYICSQKVTYIHKSLVAITTTTPAPAVTTKTTTVASTTPVTPAPSAATDTPGTTTTTAAGAAATSTAQGAGAASGSLSITTTPAGAAVYIDGMQRGVSPATIPGLTPGSHTVLLKLNGYQDLTTPVPIAAGIINEFTTGLTPLPAGATAVPITPAAGVPVTATKTQSPGFEAAAAACAVGVLLLRKTKP